MSATETSPIIAAAEARLAELADLDANAELRETCWKCSGQKYIAGFGHVLNGVCFECSGVGYKTRTVRNVRASLRRTITVERKSIEESARIAAEREAKGAAYAAANADLVEALRAYEGDDHFIADLARKLDTLGHLTEKQTEAAAAAIAREAEKAAEHAATEPVPAGRQIVTGDVLTTKYQESRYGSTLKMLVRDERGWKVWGSVPDAIFSVQKGDRVTFTATLERSDDDHAFGFFKRPTKSTIIDEAAA